MTNESVTRPTNNRYGPLGFVVTMMHILVVGLATWIFIPWSVIFVLPIVLVYMAIAGFIAVYPGKVGQVGRGMLIGSASGPLSLLIFGLVWIIAKAIGAT